MEQPIINYETLIRITKAISIIRDPEEIVLITVEGVTHSLDVRGCALFLFNAGTDDLRLAGSYGLSDEYLNKGSIDILKTMRDPKTLRDKRRTPYEGIPKSFPKEIRV